MQSTLFSYILLYWYILFQYSFSLSIIRSKIIPWLILTIRLSWLAWEMSGIGDAYSWFVCKRVATWNSNGCRRDLRWDSTTKRWTRKEAEVGARNPWLPSLLPGHPEMGSSALQALMLLWCLFQAQGMEQKDHRLKPAVSWGKIDLFFFKNSFSMVVTAVITWLLLMRSITFSLLYFRDKFVPI